MSKSDSLYDDFCDLLHETPEAEDAILKYREHRAQQSLAVARHMVREKERLNLEAAWEDLRRQLRATYVSNAMH
jgi:hypothetical protein